MILLVTFSAGWSFYFPEGNVNVNTRAGSHFTAPYESTQITDYEGVDHL